METVSRSSLRIVHVEDDHDFGVICDLFLRQAGFEQPVVRCKDGVGALRYFLALEPKQAPDVILLDLHMPQINGLEFLHWLRHGLTMRDIPVYLLTSSDEPDDRRRAAAERASGYLIKAPLFDEVIQHLDKEIAIINRRNFHQRDAREDAAGEPFVLVGEELYLESQDT